MINVGDTLGATPGLWTNSPTSFTYQWNRHDTQAGAATPIPDATNETYTVVAADDGKWLSRTQTPVNGAGAGPAETWAPVLVGAPAAFVATTWDPTTSAAGEVDTLFVNDDFTFQSVTGVNHAARGSTGHASGKRYFEIIPHTYNGSSSANTGFGIVNAGGSLTNRFGSGGINVTADGEVYANGTAAILANVGTLSSFQVLGIAVDLDNKLAWFRSGTGDWNGSPTADPATGVEGVAYTATGEMKPKGYAVSPSRISLFATDEDQVYTPPAGFSAWGGSDVGSAMPAARVAGFQNSHRGTAISRAQVVLIDDMITNIGPTIFNKMDRLIILASDTTIPVNWVTGGGAVENGTITKLADRYWKGNGVGSQNLSSNYLSNMGNENNQTNFSQNNAHMGLWSLTDLAGDATNNRFEFGSSTSYIGGGSDSNGSGLVMRACASSFDAVSDATILGHTLWSRDNASNFKLFKNGTLHNTYTRTSAVPTTDPVHALGKIDNFAGLTGGNEISILHMGAALTDAEVETLHAAFSAYLTAVGAI